MSDRLLHPLNVSLSIVFKLLGIDISVKFSQFLNAPFPMLVKLLGKVALTRFIQSSNALSPI